MSARTGWALVAPLALLTSLVVALPSRARADTLALRAPMPLGRGPVLTLGYPTSSAAFWVKPSVGVALEVRLPYDLVGAAAGWRRTLVDNGRLSLATVVGLGVQVPTIRPGVALAGQASLNGGLRTARLAGSLGLVGLGSVRLPPTVETRSALLLELWLLVRAGRVWFGLSGNAGATFSVGFDPQLALQGSAVIAFDLDVTDGAATTSSHSSGLSRSE